MFIVFTYFLLDFYFRMMKKQKYTIGIHLLLRNYLFHLSMLPLHVQDVWLTENIIEIITEPKNMNRYNSKD